MSDKGLTPDDYPHPKGFAFWWHNQEELKALHEAEEGRPQKLADLILNGGVIRTAEVRKFISDRLKGMPFEIQRRKMSQRLADMLIFSQIRDIQKEHRCKEYTARKLFLDEHPDWNEETLKSVIRRTKADWEKALGRKPSPVTFDEDD